MSSVEANDVVLDPFGGSGTTFVVCEAKHRRWIGMEIDFAPEIVERLEDDEIRHHHNSDFVEGAVEAVEDVIDPALAASPSSAHSRLCL